MLTALELDHEGKCAHRLGMGKPLGLGSFKISNVKVKLVNRSARYGLLFDPKGELFTGCETATPREIKEWKAEFAAWYFERTIAHDASEDELDGLYRQLWKEPRINSCE